MKLADSFKPRCWPQGRLLIPDPAWSASGIYVSTLLERLGIAADMKPKTKLLPPTEVLYGSIASGDVEIGF